MAICSAYRNNRPSAARIRYQINIHNLQLISHEPLRIIEEKLTIVLPRVIDCKRSMHIDSYSNPSIFPVGVFFMHSGVKIV